MDTPAATLDPLVMQDAVDRFGGRAQPAFCGGPGIPKPLGSLASAEKARAMARRKSDGLIEEEQLGPASASHDRSAATFVLTATDEPGLGGPAPVQQRLCCRIVDDATVADEHAPLGYGDNLAEGCDAVLKVHCRLPGPAGVGVVGSLHHAFRDTSRASRTRLRSTPQAYPDSEPSLRTTRWQGMATARLFAAHAPATARTAFGDPMRRAISA